MQLNRSDLVFRHANRRWLTRSHSFSEIPRGKLKQQYTLVSNGSSLTRHFSSEEIQNDGHVRILRVFSEFHISDDSRKMPLKNDQSSGSQCKQGLENMKTSKDLTERKPLTSLEESIEAPKRNINQMCKILFFPLVAAFFCVTFFEIYFALQCRLTYEVSLNELDNSLKLNVFGQKATAEIFSALKDFAAAKEQRFQIFLFYGDSGVGKSYTASLIAEHFPWEENVQYVVISTYSDVETMFGVIKKGFTFCGDNLVIIDGVTLQSLKEIILYVNRLQLEILNENVRVLVIIVFSFHEDGIQDRIDTEFHLIKIQLIELQLHEIMFAASHFKLFSFDHLSKDHVNLCIKKALLEQNKELNEEIIRHVYDSLFPYSGCKGVTSKIQLLF